MLTDKQLLEIQARVLFTHTEQGRLLNINEPDGAVAPRFFLARSKAGNLYRFRQGLPAAIVAALSALADREPIPIDLREPPQHIHAYQKILAAHAPIQHIEHGPAYYFPDTIVPSSSAAATQITSANAHLLQPPFDWLPPVLNAMPPVFAVVQHGRAVAVCFSSRIPTVADEAGVNTMAGYRGRGYATAAVTGWAQAIRALGRIPLYSTSWDNVASQNVARKLGLVPYGDDLSIS
jgi:RimJ/RimL family protein N-acetyltransferase